MKDKKKEKIDFTVKIDDKDVALMVRRPTIKESDEAQTEYIKTHRKAVDSGALLRPIMNTYLQKQGLWSEEKEIELRKLNSEIGALEKKLHDGGLYKRDVIRFEDGKPVGLAVDLKKLRMERNKLQSIQLEGNDNTAEGQAENRKFNYLVSQCTVYNNGDRVWKNFEDYLDRLNEPLAIEAYRKFTVLLYNLDPDFEAKLPENKVLKLLGYMDDECRLMRDGKFIDDDGKLVDDKGRWINEQGQLVDINGNLVDEDGNYVGETKPFLDDDGNPIELKQEEKKEQTAE
jgi:hypothetical protein